MEGLTEHMKEIALKTEHETIFMRIVTLVTLFFLPGTFVAVRRLCSSSRVVRNKLMTQTLMSTDILTFQSNGELMHKFSWLALVVYLAITVPIMLVTFYAAFRYFDREKKKTQGSVDEEKPAPVA
jgi:hypothetical protein